MKATCPSCGAGGSISLFIADADARTAIMESAKLPSDCGTLTLKYIAMFAPAKRNLTMDRAARLIREVCSMITEGVEFDRQAIKAPSYVWRAALADMLAAPNIQRPLKNHNYLLRIIQSRLASRTDASQADRHQARRAQAHVNVGPQPVTKSHECGKTEWRDPLDELSTEDRDRWLKKARETLLNDGFKNTFMAQPLIEQKAREMYMDAHHD